MPSEKIRDIGCLCGTNIDRTFPPSALPPSFTAGCREKERDRGRERGKREIEVEREVRERERERDG